MTTIERIKTILTDWGFPLRNETDTSVVFRFEGYYYKANSMDTDDRPGVAITLCGVFHAESEKEKEIALRAANDVNCEMMQIKAYIDDEDDLLVVSEFFYTEGTDVETLMRHACFGISVGKRRFRERYRSLTDTDARLTNLRLSN